ncbi:MAG: Gldg family protein [Treponema sp.]|nr:Gldg family protein [Candidatus Treponema caballi]
MKKFLAWLKSPKSDFALFIIVLILLNLVGQRAFFRFDLTSSRSYSLSEASKQVVQSLDQPLTVKVFFSDNLPSPYNTVDQYLEDLLVEYKGNSNHKFSYECFDMSKPENEEIAEEYGITQYQVQEVSNNEVGIRAVYMGLVLIYSDRIEIVDPVQTTDGLEYKLTTAISNMVSTTNTLAGLKDRVQMTLYISSRLSEFGIQGFDQVEKAVMDAYYKVNEKNLDRIEYDRVYPESSEISALAEKYGLQSLSVRNQDGSITNCALGLVLEHGGVSKTIPIQISQSFFGYAVEGLDTLETTISDSLRSLVSRSLEIGYITGHDENGLDDQQTAHGAAFLPGLVSDTYSLTQINLAEENIPGRISAIIINGPKSSFSDDELYKIDQFLMRGGNVMFFIDPFTEEADYSLYNYTGQVTTAYKPLSTGLEKLLDAYGVSLGSNYVMDEECYSQANQQYGKLSLYWIPIIRDSNINQEHQISKNLGNLVYLQTGNVNILPSVTADATVLLKSSPKAWTQSEAIMLNPLYMDPAEEEQQENIAVILEGSFRSAFDGNPAAAAENGDVTASDYLASSIQPGKVFVTGTSYITSIQLIDEDCTQPVSVFVRNVIDYMNNAGDLCLMRSKGLSVNSLTVNNQKAATFWQLFCQYGLVVVALIIAFVLWRIRLARRRQIRLMYDPDDSREEENIQKTVTDEEGTK